MNDQARKPSPAAALALHLAGQGFPVFPCNPANKHPLTPHGFKDASTDPATIATFWARHPSALVGIPTGQASGVFALDLDTDDETGEALGEAWLVSVGLAHLLDGPGALTPSGGRHVYFRADGLAEGLRNTAGKAARGVDTRGEGGYVIAPGSTGAAGAYRATGVGLEASSLPALPEALLRALAGKPKAEGKSFDFDPGPSYGAHTAADLAEVQEILSYIWPDGGSYDDWLNVLMGLHAHFGGSERGLGVAEAWSALGTKYKPGEVAAKWRGFEPGGGVNWGSVCELARQHGANLSEIARRHRGKARTEQRKGQDGARHESTPDDTDRAEFFSAADLEGEPIPPRLWHVCDLIPARTVTTLNGDGGAGKSLAALQLAVSTALGRNWLGQETTPGRALFISAEDDRDEIHRRLADIAVAEGVTLADLNRLDLRSLAGKDALLAVPVPRSEVMQETELFKNLESWIAEHKPALTVLDTLADLFGGNEVSRTQARQFIGFLRRLAIQHGTTVLLLAHPSLSGISSGTGSSGSTAWNNSVRSRLYLRRLTGAEGEDNDPDARELEVMKANYSRKGNLLPLRWREGVFHLDLKPETGLDRMAASAKAERVFLKLLRNFTEEGRFVSASPGPTFAPSIFATHPGAEGCTKRALRAAMDSLFASKRVVMASHGKGAKARSHIAFNGETT